MPPAAPDEAIERAEQALGVSFPEGMRERLRRDNGGEIAITGDAALPDEPDVWELFCVRDDTSRETLRRTADDIVREQERAREWTSFPDGVVAFAADAGGNYLVLTSDGQTQMWFHETGETFPVDVVWDPS